MMIIGNTWEQKGHFSEIRVYGSAQPSSCRDEGLLFIMEACKQSLRRRVVRTACAVLLRPGIGG